MDSGHIIVSIQYRTEIRIGTRTRTIIISELEVELEVKKILRNGIGIRTKNNLGTKISLVAIVNIVTILSRNIAFSFHQSVL